MTCESGYGGAWGAWGWNGQKVVCVKWGDLFGAENDEQESELPYEL